MSRRRNPTRIGVALLISLAVLMTCVATSAPAADSAASRADLYEMFDIEGVGAKIVLAVDTSLSMKGNFKKVRGAVDGFSQVLDRQDQLTIVVFADTARKVYSGPANRPEKISQAFPSAPDPNGQHTNMGEAIDLVLKELGEEQEKLSVVMFLTDGQDDPPPESEFAIRPAEAWRNLKDRAATQPNSQKAYVQGIALNQSTDIDRLQRIWPRARQIAIEPDELGAHFKSLKERIRRERLRHEVQKELDGGRVTVKVDESDWGALRPGSTKERAVVITSRYKKLPVEIDLKGLSWQHFQSAGQASQPELDLKTRRFLLEPGQSRTVKIKVKAPEAERQLEVKKSEEGRGRLNVAMAVNTPVAAKISELGIEPKIKTTGREREVHFTRSTGLSLYLLAGLGLMALTFLLVFGRYAVTPAGQLVYRRLFAPPLSGRLAFSAVPAGEKLPRPVSLEGLGRKVTLGTAGEIKLAGDDVKPIHAEILTGWEDGEAKMLIRPREGVVKVGRSPASAPTVIAQEAVLRAGGVVQIGGYKIQWS